MSRSKQSKKPKEIAHTRTYYNKNAELWNVKKTNSFFHEKNFVKFLDYLPKKASVLEIGCANAVNVPLFLGVGRQLKYTGLDISTSLLKIARRRYPQLVFLEGDIGDKSTLPKKKFEGFFATNVLMHVPKRFWDTMFSNIESITKPRAIGYFSLPTEHPSGAHPAHDARHFTILTPEEQVEYIKQRNWKILRRGTMDGFTKTGIWRWYIVQLP